MPVEGKGEGESSVLEMDWNRGGSTTGFVAVYGVAGEFGVGGHCDRGAFVCLLLLLVLARLIHVLVCENGRDEGEVCHFLYCKYCIIMVSHLDPSVT